MRSLILWVIQLEIVCSSLVIKDNLKLSSDR